jgi:predicted phosphodiesterase
VTTNLNTLWRILVFSDWHGKLPKIPKAYRNSETVIALCGDNCDNYPLLTFTPGIKQGTLFTPTDWKVWNYRRIDTVQEAALQNEWIETKLIPHFKANGIDLANVIVIRGNHDWADFEKYFPNALNVGSKTILFRGVKVGLLTGVPTIVGEWNDEITEWSFEDRCNALDRDIEILITHAAPKGVRDGGYGSNWLYKATLGLSFQEPHFRKLQYHFFGHSHGHHGVKKHEIEFEGKTRTLRFVNAAQNRFAIDFKPELVVES